VNVTDLKSKFTESPKESVPDLSDKHLKTLVRSLQGKDDRAQQSAMEALAAAVRKPWNCTVVAGDDEAVPEITKGLFSKRGDTILASVQCIGRMSLTDNGRHAVGSHPTVINRLIELTSSSVFSDSMNLYSLLCAITNLLALDQNRRLFADLGLGRMIAIISENPGNIAVISSAMAALSNACQLQSNAEKFLGMDLAISKILAMVRPQTGEAKLLIGGLNIVSNLYLLPDSSTGVLQNYSTDLCQRLKAVLNHENIRVRASVLQVVSAAAPGFVHMLWNTDDSLNQYLGQLLDDVQKAHEASVVAWVCHATLGNICSHSLWREAWPWSALNRSVHMLGTTRRKLLLRSFEAIISYQGGIELSPLVSNEDFLGVVRQIKTTVPPEDVPSVFSDSLFS